MLLVIFVIAAICGIGWFNEWLDKCALYRYWAERYHELPFENGRIEAKIKETGKNHSNIDPRTGGTNK